MLPAALDAVHAAAHRHVPPMVRQFVKFGMVGTVGFVVDFSTYLALTRWLGWQTVFKVFGYEVIAPNLISVLIAMAAVFSLNKYWTFRDPRAEVLARQGVSFFAVYTMTYVLNQILTSFFAFRVPVLREIFADNADLAAKIVAIAIITLLNFTGSKFLVFRGTGTARADAHA